MNAACHLTEESSVATRYFLYFIFHGQGKARPAKSAYTIKSAAA